MTRLSDSILVTGGAGFIGSNFIHAWVRAESTPVINLDLLTYAGNPGNLTSLAETHLHTLVVGDIADRALVSTQLREHRPRAVVHFAAESHVDRSILNPTAFLRTNVEGTQLLLEEVRTYWHALPLEEQTAFRFLHISTDEVYGTLGADDPPFSETTRFAPNSPYAASKAASDHIVRAYHQTYGLPVLTTNCSNNYGPLQFPEKLIPLVLLNALETKPIPLYGDGGNIRDWLFVEDHCSALRAVLARGRVGEVYNIGSSSERTNLEVVTAICDLLDELKPARHSRRALITYVSDRPGHDRRYAINADKITRELDWQPAFTFEQGLRSTVEWYLSHLDWVDSVRSGNYREWLKLNYDERAPR